MIGHSTREEDEVALLVPSRTKDHVLFFTNRGKVFSEKVYRIPEGSRTHKGTLIQNILSLGADEKVTAAVRVADFSTGRLLHDGDPERAGRKRVELSAL